MKHLVKHEIKGQVDQFKDQERQVLSDNLQDQDFNVKKYVKKRIITNVLNSDPSH